MNKSNAFSLIKSILTDSKKTIYLIFIIYLLAGLYFGSWRTQKIITHDVIIYYQYLTATFMFNDLSFEFAYNLPKDFDGQIWLMDGPGGEHYPKMTSGVAIMMSPFYLLAFGINKLFGLGSYGYSSLFQFFLFIGAMFYMTLSALIQRLILKRFFNEKVVAITLLLVFLASNYAYYVLVESGMSHIYSFFLFTCLLLFVIKWHEKASIKNGLFIGFCLGLITLVRPSNAIVVLVPFLYGIYNLESFKTKVFYFIQNYKNLIPGILACFIIVSFQFLFWKYCTGKWYIYGYNDEGFFFSDPKFFKGLFGFRKGFLIYTPIALFSIIGFFIKKKEIKKLRFALIAFCIINMYIVFSWWCWWYGGGYGQRALIEGLAFFTVFMAIFVDFILRKRRKVKVVLAMIAVFLTVQNGIQMLQYSKGILHWHGMTAKAYKNIFFKLKYPDNYSDFIEEPDYDAAKKGNR